MINIDFLFLVEHEDREGETVKAIAGKLRDLGAESVVLSIEFHSYLFKKFKPRCVVFPYAIDASRWPLSYFDSKYFEGVKFISLNWEQLLSTANKEFKKPKGELITELFEHLSWSEDFADFLVESGVNRGNVRVLGNPAHEMLFHAINNAETWSAKLKTQYSIPSDAEVIFFPMNYGWAFATDRVISAKIEMGYDSDVAWKYREYSKRCLHKFVDFSVELALQKKDAFIVIRPHPSISVEQYKEVYSSIGKDIPKNILLTKEYTIREWISVSDVVGSSWSTTVWDSVCVGKKGFLFTPEPRPAWLDTYWNDKVVNVSTVDELLSIEDFVIGEQISPDRIVANVAKWLQLPSQNSDFSTLNSEKFSFKRILYMARSAIRTFLMEYCGGKGVPHGLQRDYFKPMLNRIK